MGDVLRGVPDRVLYSRHAPFAAARAVDGGAAHAEVGDGDSHLVLGAGGGVVGHGGLLVELLMLLRLRLHLRLRSHGAVVVGLLHLHLYVRGRAAGWGRRGLLFVVDISHWGWAWLLVDHLVAGFC